MGSCILSPDAEEDFTPAHVFESPDNDEEDEDEVTPRMKPVGIVYYHRDPYHTQYRPHPIA
ncbi:hypothetical protein PM082_007445 [Marasmius tenuissimus]|nr:hypothetical protein PM082_007445 [Marasmius tenuissimus]